MNKEEITKEILSILGNFKLSENIQIKELVSLYMKQEQEIERLHSIIKEVREKLLCYGETFDLKVHQEMQKELLEILDKEVIKSE